MTNLEIMTEFKIVVQIIFYQATSQLGQRCTQEKRLYVNMIGLLMPYNADHSASHHDVRL